MWSKRQIVMKAFGELGLAGYEFDIAPEEVQDALARLDAMMATWEGLGIRVGYAFPASPDDSDPDTPSGLPDKAVETVYANLAVRMAASYGKAINPDTKRTASTGYGVLLSAAARPGQQQLPSTLPVGAGNRPWRIVNNPFFPRPVHDPLPVDCAGDMDIPPEQT